MAPIKTIKDDTRIAQLEQEGWTFTNNYDPRNLASVVNALTVSNSPYYHPMNAGEVLLTERAYDFEGNLVPEWRAVYVRDCKVWDRKEPFQIPVVNYIPQDTQ